MCYPQMLLLDTPSSPETKLSYSLNKVMGDFDSVHSVGLAFLQACDEDQKQLN